MKTANLVMKLIIPALLPFLTALAQSEINTAAQSRGDLYQIGPGDVLEVRVFNRPQLSRDSVRVDNRGIINLPMIEDGIVARCRTESELGSEIGKLYLKFLRRPHVEVFVKEFNSNPVSVIGAVDKPGQFQLHRPVRLLELISLAGGPTQQAGERLLIAHTTGVVACAVESTSETGHQSYNLNETLRGEERANPYVQPGDVITIPEAQQAFVIGNVFKPGNIPLKETITVSQAIAMAGGTLPDTKKDRVRILRQGLDGRSKTEIVVDLNAVLRLQAKDIELLPNDIVEVPVSAGRRFLRGLSNAIAPSLPLRVIR